MKSISHIPKYPNFVKLSLNHQNEIANFRTTPPFYSDFNFTSLWCENVNDNFEISTLNNNLVILFKDYICEKPFFSFLGSNNVNHTSETLLERSKKEGYSNFLKLVPEVNFQDFKKTPRFKISEDIDHFDYIFPINDLASLKGSRFRHKRNNINQLIRLHPDCRVKITKKPCPQDIKEIFELAHLWKADCSKKNREVLTLERILANPDPFPIEIISVYLGDKVIAFEIHERIGSTTMGHFKNCNHSFQEAEDYLTKELACYLLSDGCSFINGMQDLGLPHLRNAKSLWRPSHFLKKYMISNS